MTEQQMEMLAKKFAETLQQSRSVSDSEHFDHHQWIAKRIIAEDARKKFYTSLSERLAEKSLWALIGVVGVLLWYGVGVAIKKVIGQ